MTDILIRGVSDELLAVIDANAKAVGLSRTAYLRRALEREHVRSTERVTVDQMARLTAITVDLDDPAVMADAWS